MKRRGFGRLRRRSGERLLILGAAAVVLALGSAAWWGTGRVVEERRREIGEALGTVLEMTHQAIASWAGEHRATAEVWAGSPEVVALAKQLLATPRSRESLLHSSAQSALRSRLHPVLRSMRYQGFFIIAPDGTNLSSSRDSNIGVPNLLLRARKDGLARLWLGETVITSPQPSDVVLPDANGEMRENQPTMFVGSAIRNGTGSVIAALTFRIDPSRDFTSILQRGRIGASGETYAFDHDGRLVSESRFDQQLASIGLLGPDQRGILDIEIRDPGENLLRAGKKGIPMTQRPLTHMAESAVAGGSGMNLDGYRDYRGVFVIGAWLWDLDLNLGLSSEIDRSEAYSAVGVTRSIILALTALAICMTVGLAMLFAIRRRLSERLEDALTKVLSGYVPICAACKKIRDEAGDWTEVERYVGSHTAAEFTHSICPACEQELYPELD